MFKKAHHLPHRADVKLNEWKWLYDFEDEILRREELQSLVDRSLKCPKPQEKTKHAAAR